VKENQSVMAEELRKLSSGKMMTLTAENVMLEAKNKLLEEKNERLEKEKMALTAAKFQHQAESNVKDDMIAHLKEVAITWKSTADQAISKSQR